MNTRYFFWMLLLFPMQQLSAQGSATAAFIPDQTEVGEAFILQISLRGPNPNPPDTFDLSGWQSVLPPEQLLGQTSWSHAAGHWVKNIQFIAFEEGAFTLPPVTLLTDDGSVVLTDSLHLTVTAPPLPSTDLNDMAGIKDIHREKKNWTDYLWIGWVVGGLLVLLLLLYWISRKPKNNGPLARNIAMPPYELAVKKLDALAQQQLWQNGNTKEYYAELSFILREFLNGKYRIRATESSTDEMPALLQKTSLTREQQADLLHLFANADLAKFAKGLPGPEYHPVALSEAYRFLEATRNTL